MSSRLRRVLRQPKRYCDRRSKRSGRVPSSHLCVGCDIVQSDHAPEAGVAQGIFHGILVRHRRNQEEVEVGLEEEVEREKEEGHSRTSAHVE